MEEELRRAEASPSITRIFAESSSELSSSVEVDDDDEGVSG